MTKPNKYFYKYDQNELVTEDGVVITANALLPQITLGQKPTINIQLVNDDMTPFTGLASGTVAQLMVDTDFKNDAIPVPLGASGWTNPSGSEYRKYLAYEPDGVFFGGTAGTEGTIGSLAAGGWAYNGTTDHIYVRLPDSGNPSGKADNYITAEFDTSESTPPYIECYSDSFNTTGSWYTTSGTFATPDVTQGQLAFALNANTVNYYQRIGTQERAQGNAQMQFYFGGENIANRKMTMILWNRITGSDSTPLELDGIGYYKKAEADSRYVTQDLSGYTNKLDLDDADELFLNSSTGGTFTITGAVIKSFAPGSNILINTDPANMINQRGNYSAGDTASFTFDRWQATQSTVSSTAAGITINGAGTNPMHEAYFIQTIENPPSFSGKNVTFSVTVANAAVGGLIVIVANGKWIAQTYWKVSSNPQNISATCTLPANCTALSACVVLRGVGAITIKNLKFEEGSIATPWCVPAPQQELARCMRYYQRVNLYSVRTVDETGFMTGVQFFVPMRTTPSVYVYDWGTNTAGYISVFNGSYTKLAATVDAITSTGARISCPTTWAVGTYWNVDAYVIASAEII